MSSVDSMSDISFSQFSSTPTDLTNTSNAETVNDVDIVLGDGNHEAQALTLDHI